MQIGQHSHPELSPVDYWKTLVERVKNNIITLRFGQKTRPVNNSAVFYRTVTEKSNSKSIIPVSEQVRSYRYYITLPDFVDVNSRTPLLDYAMNILASEAWKNILDESMNELVSGTNVIYADEASSRILLAGDKKLTKADIRRAVNLLQGENIQPFEDGSYVCLIHPDKLLEIFTAQELEILGKTKVSGTEEGSVLQYAGTKFYMTTALPIVQNGTIFPKDVYFTLVFGKNAYGVVDIDHTTLKIDYLGMNEEGKADIIYCEAHFAVKRLDEKAIVRIESN